MNPTTRSGSGTGTGFSSTALTTEKIAVFAPIPSVSAATAATVNAGLCTNIRRECLRSLRNASNMMLVLQLSDCGQPGDRRRTAYRLSQIERLDAQRVDSVVITWFYVRWAAVLRAEQDGGC